MIIDLADCLDPQTSGENERSRVKVVALARDDDDLTSALRRSRR
jgi:hypothetical protein